MAATAGTAGMSDEEFVRTEKWKLLPAFIKMKGIARHHIESFNYLVDVEMKKIVEHNALVTSDSNPSIYLRYTNIYVEPPTVEQDMVVSQVTPNECRLRDLTYAGTIKVDVEFTKLGKDGNQRFTKTGQSIGKLPMMLKCNKCHLYNKNFEELARQRECPYDPGGYFIVKGVEKAFLMQEQMSKNRIIIETGKLGISATCASHTHTSKGKTTIVFGKDKGMYLKHNSLTDLMPIFVVMRAMGVQSDQELVQMVGTEPSMMLYLYPCIYACKKNNVYTQQDALEFFGNHMKPKQWLTGREIGPKKSKADEAADFLANILLCHVPVVNWDFHQKVVYLAVMLRRMILAVDDPSQLDDKDYYGNKRLELAGQLLALLFEDLFKTYNSNLKAAGETCLKKAARAQQFDFVQVMNCTNMTRGFNYAISSGNWNIKRFKVERSGVTQVLRRMARIDTVGMITRVNSHFEKSRKVSGPRTLQPSTWGMLCPSDTPEGESCGLVKNMSLMSVVTSDLDEKPVYTTCLNLGMEDIDMVFGEDLQLHTIVSLNGLIIGIHRHPDAFVVAFRTLRRAGRLYPSASIYQNKSQKCVYISTDGGRLCRPLIIVNHQKGSVRPHHLHELAEGVRNFEDFLREGQVEFLDVNEENDCFIALREENIDAETTHLEIEPFTLLERRQPAADVLVNKYIPAASDEGGAPYRPAPLCYKGPVAGYVDQVLISTDEEDTWIIKVLLRETRAPELGDKFSSRHGQKGVCGLIQPAPDLPFNDHGMNPDLIMNPHGFPSRMTVGKMIELVAGKAGVLEGKLKYGTAFGGDKVADCGRILVQNGYNYHGRDQLYSGITGEPLEAYVFMGPVYYQKLKHMVLDKMHARGRGPCSALTRQPTEGRSRDGGLRLGEMERDCLIGHGASNLLKERLLHSSDEFNTDVCKACGLIGYGGWCQYCKSRRDVVSIKMPYACKLLFQELMAMNIVPRLTLQPL